MKKAKGQAYTFGGTGGRPLALVSLEGILRESSCSSSSSRVETTLAAAAETQRLQTGQLSFTVLSPARKPVALCVVVVVAHRVSVSHSPGSRRGWRRPGGRGAGARSRVENSWMLPLWPQRMFRAHIRCDQ